MRRHLVLVAMLAVLPLAACAATPRSTPADSASPTAGGSGSTSASASALPLRETRWQLESVVTGGVATPAPAPISIVVQDEVVQLRLACRLAERRVEGITEESISFAPVSTKIAAVPCAVDPDGVSDQVDDRLQGTLRYSIDQQTLTIRSADGDLTFRESTGTRTMKTP